MTGLLVIGQSGQLARELARLAPEAHFAGRAEAELTRPEACAALIAHLRPAAVINAAAYTAVDRAEAEPELAHLVNGAAPGAMARACAALGVPFLHVSTDYVFDGSGTEPHRPEDAPAPLNTYGASKLAGERAVEAAGGHWAVVRTSWVVSAHGRNFVSTMLQLGAERPRLRVVADQIGGPTPAADLARALLTMAKAMQDGARGGLTHFAGEPEVSWAGFAREIFARAGMGTEVEEIASADWPTPAPRPLNSRLDCTSLARGFGLPRPDWRAGLDAILKELSRP